MESGNRSDCGPTTENDPGKADRRRKIEDYISRSFSASINGRAFAFA